MTQKLEDYAEALAIVAMGNWRRFDSFSWGDRPEDCERWAIIYTHHRDSGLLDLSNASVYERVLEAEEYEADVRSETHRHWARGWVAGFAIRVRDEQLQLTPAWLAYAELKMQQDVYAVLDENDFSDREYQAAIDVIQSELNGLGHDRERAGEVYGWLAENEPSELEDHDSQGPMPAAEAVERAFEAIMGPDTERDEDAAKPIYGPDDVGCFGDGAYGHVHIRCVLANLLDEHFGDVAAGLILELRGEMSDDAGEELEAIDRLNELYAPSGLRFEMIDGDLMLINEYESEEP